MQQISPVSAPEASPSLHAAIKDRLENIGVNERFAAEFERIGVVTKEQMMAVTQDQIAAVVKAALSDISPTLVEPMRHMFENQLLYASQHENLVAVQDALAHNASVDFTDSDRSGNTALMLAAARGHCAIVEALLGAGASIKLTSHGGYTCLHRVCFARRRGVIEGHDPLDDERDRQMRLQGLTEGAKQWPQGHISTPHHIFCQQREQIAILLIESGADLSTENEAGKLFAL
jgi:hypothetical protein